MQRTRSGLVSQLGEYLRKNWVNLVVLGIILSLSASASLIIYRFANDSIADVSNEMLLVALGDIKSRVGAYITNSISIIPAAKAFLQARQVDTGANPNPDIYRASKLWGYFFNTTANTANSLFYLDKYGNNLGWGIGPTGPGILLQWTSVVPGVNLYTPVNGQIANLSDPDFHQDTLISFPALQKEQDSGQPYWQSVYLLRVGATSVMPLISYSEPAYFDDTNEFCCIVGANIYINAFEGVLASYNIAKDGKIFITDDKGTLIADSLGGLKLILNELDSSPVQQPVLPNATDHKDPTVRRAAQFLIHKFGSFSAIPDGDHSLTFKSNGETQILLAGQFIRNNLKMNIVIVVPYSSFFAKIQMSRRITIAFTVIAVVCGFVRYLFAWRLMSRKNGASVSPDARSLNSSTTSGFPSTISVAISSQTSSASLFESPAVIRRDVFGENSPAISRDLP